MSSPDRKCFRFVQKVPSSGDFLWLLAIRSGWFIKEYRISMIYLIAGKLQIGLPT